MYLSSERNVQSRIIKGAAIRNHLKCLVHIAALERRRNKLANKGTVEEILHFEQAHPAMTDKEFEKRAQQYQKRKD